MSPRSPIAVIVAATAAVIVAVCGLSLTRACRPVPEDDGPPHVTARPLQRRHQLNVAEGHCGERHDDADSKVRPGINRPADGGGVVVAIGASRRHERAPAARVQRASIGSRRGGGRCGRRGDRSEATAAPAGAVAVVGEAANDADAVLEEPWNVEEGAGDEDGGDRAPDVRLGGCATPETAPQRMADGQIATDRHGNRQPRAGQHEVVYDGPAVRRVKQFEGQSVVDEPFCRYEGVRQQAGAQQQVGHSQGLQPHVDRPLGGWTAAASGWSASAARTCCRRCRRSQLGDRPQSIAAEHNERQGVADQTEGADDRHQFVLDDVTDVRSVAVAATAAAAFFVAAEPDVVGASADRVIVRRFVDVGQRRCLLLKPMLHYQRIGVLKELRRRSIGDAWQPTNVAAHQKVHLRVDRVVVHVFKTKAVSPD